MNKINVLIGEQDVKLSQQHIYSVAGVPHPSVTQIIKNTNIYEGMSDFQTEAMLRGSDFHETVERTMVAISEDNNADIVAIKNEVEIKYPELWHLLYFIAKTYIEHSVRVDDIEKRFAIPGYFAGTIDACNFNTVFEIKTGDFRPEYLSQVAGYSLISPKIKQCIIIYFDKETKRPATHIVCGQELEQQRLVFLQKLKKYYENFNQTKEVDIDYMVKCLGFTGIEGDAVSAIKAKCDEYLLKNKELKNFAKEVENLKEELMGMLEEHKYLQLNRSSKLTSDVTLVYTPSSAKISVTDEGVDFLKNNYPHFLTEKISKERYSLLTK